MNKPILRERLRDIGPCLDETYPAVALQKLTNEAADELDRLERQLQAAPTWQAFFDKYALGPKQMPSCLVCGNSAIPWPPAIQHAELPGIVVCHSCRDARLELDRLAAEAGHYKFAAESCASFSTVVIAERDALAARVAELEPDARRYRWLRKYCESASGLHFDWYVSTVDGDWGDDAETFDAAIDAALNRTEGET